MNPPAIAAQLIERVPLLRGFSPERVQSLVEGARAASFAAGEVILRAGEAATDVGVVLRGAVRVCVLDEQPTRPVPLSLQVGDTFNEVALLTGAPVAAEISALSPCDVLLINVSLLQAAIVAEPHVAALIAPALTERLASCIDQPLAAAANRRQAAADRQRLRGERRERILVINCGSSSLKYSFYDTDDAARSARGLVERIGIEGTRLVHHSPRGELRRDLPEGDFTAALSAMLEALTGNESGVITDPGEVSLVAHRVVHGGERFTEATLIDDGVLAQLDALGPLAPLHNPVNIAGIRAMRRMFPEVPQVAVFDTAFHHTLPPRAYLYGLPYSQYEQHAVRRYGFHGTSHQDAGLRAAQFLQRVPNELRLISCHLGNGASLCAIDRGRSVDTSMGFTPAEGLIMGTRCGDIDAGVLAFFERTQQLSASQSEELLNRQSGLLGLSGISSDLREVIGAAEHGAARALLALQAYCYRVRKYLGAYAAALGGVDAIVFTGGIGQGSADVRALALQGLECLGVLLDAARNRTARGFDEICRISADSSPVAVLVVPADEERQLAREALQTLSRARVTLALAAEPPQPFPIAVREAHVHLSREHFGALFGDDESATAAELTSTVSASMAVAGDVSPRLRSGLPDRSSNLRLTIIGPRGRVEGVRVVGPPRRDTQIEIAMSEQFRLGIFPPIRDSGDIAGTPGCVLEGPAGRVEVDRGVIAARPHVHMAPEDALRRGLRDRSVVRVRIEADNEVLLSDVLVRVAQECQLAMHIDTDGAQAAGLPPGAQGTIVGIQSQEP